MNPRILLALLLLPAAVAAEPTSEQTILRQRWDELPPLQKVQMMPMPEKASPFAGLKFGARDAAPGGPVRRLQLVLFGRWLSRLNYRADWAASLRRDEPGVFGDETMKMATLFKAVYGTGRDGGSIDEKTAALLSAVESGAFWKESLAPEKSAGGAALYRAARFLGAPYQMGGSGLASGSVDCGLLTQLAVGRDGMTRLADYQYDDARAGARGFSLRSAGEAPEPGDLVFFNCPTSQSGIAIAGVTHVGIALGNRGGEPLVLDARTSTGVGVHSMLGCVKAYGAIGAR